MKLKNTIFAVIIFAVIALTLQIVALILKTWMYAPSVENVVDGKNITFYQLRGLWESQNMINKYQVSGKSKFLDANKKYDTLDFKPADLGGWFDAVRTFEVAGAVINFGAMCCGILWYFSAKKNDFMPEGSSCSTTFVTLIIAGILDLLGVTILIGKIEPEMASWAGTLSGFAGTFCITGAAFIRYWQQEKFD